DGSIDVGDAQALADRLVVALGPAAAYIGGTGGTVVRLHPAAALPAAHDPLQQRWPRSGRPAAGLELAGVIPQPRPISHVLVPAARIGPTPSGSPFGPPDPDRTPPGRPDYAHSRLAIPAGVLRVAPC